MYAFLDEELRLSAALHDKKLDANNTDRKISEEEAKRIAADPLAHFPNDEDYSVFTLEYLEPKVSAAREYIEKRGIGHVLNPLELRSLWTPERAAAVSGNDPVAKRAAINGKLWALYLHMKKCAGEVTLEQLRSVLAKELAVYKVCPSMQEAQEYNKGKPEAECYNMTRDMVEIPAEHIQKLVAEGRLESSFRDAARYGNLPLLTGVIAHV